MLAPYWTQIGPKSWGRLTAEIACSYTLFWGNFQRTLPYHCRRGHEIMHVLAVLFKLREELKPYPGGIKGFLRALRSQNEYFVDLREDFTYTTDPLV